MADQRQIVREIFERGVAAADPYQQTAAQIGVLSEVPSQIIAVGKAALKMTEAALDAFPGVPALVVTNYENAKPLDGATVLASGHPVPDENGLAAGQAVIAALSNSTGSVLALISGGGSALLPAPVEGISLAEKAAVNELLLSSGMDITEMNLVRQQLSQIKGGGMLRHAAPHRVTALILSDVIGDDISAIASGPTAPPLGDTAQVRALLQQNGFWDQLPEPVQAHLAQDSVVAELPEHANHLVGSNGQSVAAMAAADAGITTIPTAIEGDVADAARAICVACGHGTTVWGGETTVVLNGDGRGGRNQELALRIALEAKARGWTDWTCLQGGSDGRDGPTDAAGGIVDAGTLDRIAAAGGDIDALLTNNDSYKALEMAGDLLITDATGTNVADLGVMIRR
ncbi:glycerate kinase type-2 family protein [Cognatiyoonia sp.]|uniref:glycerate kinase type-2 family protein n=1 Tax=Cognatiyoonia sp. TaxID=2211652 RepID=UPI003F69CBBB